MTDVPTDIEKVANLSNPVVRNLCITQRYHDLSRLLAETIGDNGGVNWSTFATWASKTAGQSIRNEEVPRFVNELLIDSADDVMHPLGRIETAVHALVPTTGFHPSFLLAPIAEAVATVSTSIARGNQKVFKELAPEFARFVTAFRGAPPPLDNAIADWLETLDPRPTADGGQQELRQAFSAYAQAMHTSDPVEKARLVLFGNCLIGLHEQMRLQPEIQEAMDAPIDVILKSHLHVSFGTGAAAGIFSQLVAAVERPLDSLIDIVEDIWERVATRLLMKLALPGGMSLPLGRNIPKDAAAHDFIPVPLQNITAPGDLVSLLRMYDRARGVSDIGSASVDWRILEDRMNFIVNLFRSRHTDSTLLSPPFDEAQRAAIEAGVVPAETAGL